MKHCPNGPRRLRWRPLTILIPALALGLLAVMSLAPPAGAARYTVSECGWYVDHDAGWAQTASNKFFRSAFCQPPRSQPAFEGAHLTSETVAGSGSVGATKFARWRWNAPAGTTITNVQGHRWQVLNDGFQHRLGGATAAGFTPFLTLTGTDTARRDFRQNLPAGTVAFESRLLCALASGQRCSTTRASQVGVRALVFVLEDPSAPTVTATPDWPDGDWFGGVRSLDWTATDQGSGLRSAETSIDGVVRAQTRPDCDIVNVGGQVRGSRMRPCPVSRAGSHRVDTTALSDGIHRLVHCVTDFAGNRSCRPEVTVRSDNTPPAAPRDLEVTGGSEWRRENGFDLAWTIPGQDNGAPVTGSRLRLSDGDFNGDVLAGDGPDATAGLTVPGPGEYRVRVWLVDAAGNEREEAAAWTTVRFDDRPPRGFFLQSPENRPELLRATAGDDHSGIAGGTIAIRRVGSDHWQELPTVLAAGDREETLFTARVPSEELGAGRWQARTIVRDRAGNETVITGRANGAAVSFETPLRQTTVLNARLAGPRGQGARVTVPYGRGARLSGRLLAGGNGLAGQPVKVTELPAAGARRRPVTRTVRTGSDGRFALRLPRGASRHVTLAFAGSERVAPATVGPLALHVRAGLRFRARPRSLRTGRQVRFRGRVRSGQARRPARGAMIAIQYRERASGRWRPVLVTRTGPRGRFRARYRFRYIRGRAVIRLRAVLLSTAGFPYVKGPSRTVRVTVRG